MIDVEQERHKRCIAIQDNVLETFGLQFGSRYATECALNSLTVSWKEDND